MPAPASCAGSCRPTARCTRRRRSSTASVYITGCDENFRGVRLSDGAVLFTIPTGAYTGASPVVDGRARRTSARSTTKCWASICGPRKIVWRYRNPDREFPFYSSAALVDGRVIVGGRDKSVHAIDAASGKGDLDVRDAGARRFVAGDRRRPGLRRIERRTSLRARRGHRPEAVGVRRRRRPSPASPAIAAGRVVIAARRRPDLLFRIASRLP